MSHNKNRNKPEKSSPVNFKLFEHTLDSISECISITDMEDRIIFVNKAFCDTYGYTQSELNNKGISVIRSNKNPSEKIKEILPETLKGGWSGRLWNRKKDGTEFLISLRTFIAKDEEGNPIALVGVAEDLTSREKAERKIRRLETKYRKLFLEIKDTVYESTPDGKLIDINPSGLELFGYDSQEEMMNLDVSKDLYANPKDRDIVMELMNQDGFVKNHDIKIKRKNGNILHVLVTSYAVKNNKGKVVSYRGIIRDISELKNLEDQLKLYVGEVAQANKKLYESETQLKSLNAAKDRFFSIIAHDLRSPFNSLLGMTDLIAGDFDELSNEELKTLAERTNKSAHNVFDLLENLLQWARIQTGRMEFVPVNIDLFETTELIRNLLSNESGNKQINLVNKVPKQTKIFADSNMMNSVLQNLVSNAIKFTQPGGTITISVINKEKMVNVSVSDTGVGIDESDLDKLFKIDVHHTTTGTSDEKGTGLGLILCRELVEKNGGNIWVTSKLKKGTTFTFAVPKSE